MPTHGLAQSQPSQEQVVAANRTTYFDGDPLDRRRFDTFGVDAPPSDTSRIGFDAANLRGKKTRRQIKAALAPKPFAVPSTPLPNPAMPATYLRPQPRVGASAEPLIVVPPDAQIYADGTVAPITGSVARIVQQRRPVVPAVEPFDPLGLRVGAFIVKPAIEITGGHDNNVPRSTQPQASSFVIFAPELLAQSDWERHELRASLRGSYTSYKELPSFNKPNLDTKVNARVDVSSQTRVDLEGRALFATESPGDPNFPTGVSTPPKYTVFGTTAGVAHRFNRLEMSLKGTFDRTEYEDATLNNGTILSNDDLNYRQYGVFLRGSYEIGPGVRPFVEIGADKRQHDNPVDTLGIARDSTGTVPRVGTTFEMARWLTGEISGGYMIRNYEDPSLQQLRGAVLDASLVWTASALTRAMLTATTTADESRDFGISGILRRDVALQVDHAFRQWLILTGRVGAGVDDFQGSDREDRRYYASALLTYKLNPDVWLKGEVRQEWFTSNIPDSDYQATMFLVGLRFQR